MLAAQETANLRQLESVGCLQNHQLQQLLFQPVVSELLLQHWAVSWAGHLEVMKGIWRSL